MTGRVSPTPAQVRVALGQGLINCPGAHAGEWRSIDTRHSLPGLDLFSSEGPPFDPATNRVIAASSVFVYIPGNQISSSLWIGCFFKADGNRIGLAQ